MFLKATWHEERYGEGFRQFYTNKQIVSGLLHGKMKKHTCGWRIYKLKMLVKRRNNVFRRKQLINQAPLTFLDVKKLKET